MKNYFFKILCFFFIIIIFSCENEKKPPKPTLINDVVIEELDKPQVIWTEDITTEWLEDYFKVVLKKLPTPFTSFDYKTYYKPEDMKIIREIFEERFYNEFQYYGYQLA